ncbi:hypothetical protein JIN77_01915 [Verrucomicrobiaceae bacterium R5-34]|nr:hypothetical protein [Verrucomicrobiaceae bacterium R5-34]
MKPQNQTPSDLPHLTQSDLDRVVSADEAQSIPMLCHEADCFIHGSELGIMMDPESVQSAVLNRKSH